MLEKAVGCVWSEQQPRIAPRLCCSRSSRTSGQPAGAIGAAPSRLVLSTGRASDCRALSICCRAAVQRPRRRRAEPNQQRGHQPSLPPCCSELEALAPAPRGSPEANSGFMQAAKPQRPLGKNNIQQQQNAENKEQAGIWLGNAAEGRRVMLQLG